MNSEMSEQLESGPETHRMIIYDGETWVKEPLYKAALAREQALKFDLETRELQIKTIAAWLDAKIAEQEAEDAKAKACEWVDYPLFKRVVLPVPSVRYDCSDLYISDIQTHHNFAGIVDNDGKVFPSWDDWVSAKKEWNPTARGFRIPTPKAVRMWREGTVAK